MKRNWLIIGVFAMLGLAACGGDTAVVEEGAGDAAVDTTPVQTEGLGDSLLSETRVYFEFDSAGLTEEARSVIEAHAKHLGANSSISVTLEGHADERGTREYNLALGERRAKAVARMMSLLGVDNGRIKVTSYGEEKPLDNGHDESAWRMNRRVEIIY